MTVSCPACTHLLASNSYGSVSARVCETGCGGIWLGPQDIQSLVQTPRLVDKMLAATGSVLPQKHSQARQCPDCQTSLDAWNVKGQTEVEIDICPGCQGIWLDQGEVATLVLLNRKGQPQPEQSRKQQVHTEERASSLAIAGSMADDVLTAAVYFPYEVVQLAEVGVDLATVAIDAAPAAFEAVATTADAIASVTDAAQIAVVATEVVAATADVLSATAEIASGIGEVIGGLFEFLSIFG